MTAHCTPISPAEVQGVDAHLAQSPAGRGRLDEERGLITRAGELLALAAPPDRELPPFRVGDVKPPTRLWWKVRLPLAWAATLVLALGIGTYLGSGVEQRQQPETAADAEPARPQALQSPLRSERARRESRVKPRVAEMAAIPRDTALSAATPAPAPAPQPAFVMLDGALVEKASPITVDSARALLGADPLAVPGAPIRAIHSARQIGYSAVVSVAERAPLSRARITDSLAAAPAAKAAARLGRYETGNRVVRRLDDLEIQISGPLPSDSLGKLLLLVQPVKP